MTLVGLLALGCGDEPSALTDAALPVDAMAVEDAARAPDARVVDAAVEIDAGAADATPLPDAAVVALTVAHTGDGAVVVTPPGSACAGTCTLLYPLGSSVTLTAQPDTCRRFSGWSGDCAGTGDCVLTMDADRSATAAFFQGADLTVSTVGPGAVSSDVAGIDCGSDCAETYNACELVTLSATPDPGYRLEAWTGDCQFDCVCRVEMNTERDATATFGPTGLNWARSFIGGDHYPAGLAIDDSGKIAIAGAFSDGIVLGGETTAAVGSNQDVYVVKLSATGDHIWHRTMVGEGNNWGLAVATDPAGNVLVGGRFSGDIDLGGGTVSALAGSDAFVAKYAAADGAFLWAKVLSGPSAAEVRSIAIDTSGDVIVTGKFDVSIDIDGVVHSGAGGQDGFLAKLASADGARVWSVDFGATYSDWGQDAAVDSADDVLLTGTMGGIVDLGCGSLLGFGSGYDVFLAKFDGVTGSCTWSVHLGGADREEVMAIDVGPDDGMVITGFFDKSAAFGGATFTSAGNDDGFVASFDGDGGYRWSTQIAGAGLEYPRAIVVDSSGDAIVGGEFNGLADFGATSSCSVEGRFSAFAAKYDTSGAHVWTRDYGDDWTYGAGVATDNSDAVIITGQFSDSIDFGGGSIVAPFGRNSFLVSLSP